MVRHILGGAVIFLSLRTYIAPVVVVVVVVYFSVILKQSFYNELWKHVINVTGNVVIENDMVKLPLWPILNLMFEQS